MTVVKTRQALMCVHGESVASCEICQDEMRNGQEVPARPVTVAAEIQMIEEEE